MHARTEELMLIAVASLNMFNEVSLDTLQVAYHAGWKLPHVRRAKMHCDEPGNVIYQTNLRVSTTNK